jgi:hypothetical protein
MVAHVARVPRCRGERVGWDAGPAARRDPRRERDGRVAEHVGGRERPRRERQLRPGLREHPRRQTEVVLVGVGREEEGDLPGLDARGGKPRGESVPPGVERRAGVDEAPAVVELEQEGVDVGGGRVPERERELHDPVVDRPRGRLVGPPWERTHLGRRLGPRDLAHHASLRFVERTVDW